MYPMFFQKKFSLFKISSNGRILLILDKCIFISNKNQILYSNNGGKSFHCIAEYFYDNIWKKMTTINNLTARLFRSGFHNLALIDSTMITIFNNIILIKSGNNKKLRNSFFLKRGTRPLSFCVSKNKALYWGEYFNNPKREEVYIYGSFDRGESFKVVHKFPLGYIRHIHGIYKDPYTGALWVTTGDTDQESGIWVSENEFKSLEKVFMGSQQVRAVQLLFTKKYIYFGSDTPLEKNYLYRIDKKTKKLEKLQEVENSVFWGCKVGKYLFFSTIVEPSNINKIRYTCIWGSIDGKKWGRILGFYKDKWPMRLFQYGQIFFPVGENNTNRLWFTPFASDMDQTIQYINISDIF